MLDGSGCLQDRRYAALHCCYTTIINDTTYASTFVKNCDSSFVNHVKKKLGRKWWPVEMKCHWVVYIFCF